MHSLELQSAVNEVKKFGTGNVHRRPQLALRKGFLRSKIRSTCTPVRQSDLNV